MRRFDLHQDKAGKKSKELFRQLVVVQFFTLLISGLVLGVFFTLLIYCFYDNDGHRYRRSGRRLGYRRHYAKRHYDPKAVQHKGPLYDYVINEHGYPTLPVAFGVAYLAGMGLMGGVIVIGGYYKFQELKEGGVRVAESLAATEIPKTTGDEAERTLLNIVQELALASGISVPTAYVLKGEKGINAFAAGHTDEDAVIVVTEEALRRLSRDQMQGVIAHEFSHILNGDMARNMKLMAFTYGNFYLIELAEGMIDTNQTISEDPLRSEHGFAALGYVLYPLGLLNSVVALAFTAGIKRQGEYLADATAVELARYPRGLSEALMMIAGSKDKGRIRRKGATSMNYMFLVDGVNNRYRMFESHPEIDRRILRLQPDWDGYYLYEKEGELEAYGEAYDDVAELAGLAKLNARGADIIPSSLEQVAPLAIGAVAAMSNEGPPPVKNEEESLVEGDGEIPDWLAIDDTQPIDIDPNVFQLALHQEIAGLVLASLRLEQFDKSAADKILSKLDPMIAGGVNKVRPVIAGLDEGQKMWMFDHALETVAGAPAMVRTLFADFVNKTAVAPEHEKDIARWAWQRVINAKIKNKDKRQARYGEMEPLRAEVMVVLSALTHADSDGQMEASYNFMRSVIHTDLENHVLIPSDHFGVAEIDEALERLSWMSARLRRKVVVACAAGTTANRSVNLDEAWLMRAICCGLNFPSPKLYPGQALTAGV